MYVIPDISGLVHNKEAECIYVRIHTPPPPLLLFYNHTHTLINNVSPCAVTVISDSLHHLSHSPASATSDHVAA